MQKAKRFAIIIGVVLALIIIGGITAAAIFGALLDLLYICLIILAVLMVGATLFQVYSVLLLVRTILLVRNEMKPLLASVQETVGIVKDTARTAGSTVSTIGTVTRLTSEIAVGPGVRTAATVVAGSEMLRVFLGKGKTRSRADERRRRQQEAVEAAAVAEGKQ